jgi:hypothetical protein
LAKLLKHSEVGLEGRDNCDNPFFMPADLHIS